MEATASNATLPEAMDARPRLLFVDDEEAILNTMRIMFRRQYDVLLASNGQAALDLLRDNDVDVIVSDQRMPGMVGVEVLREARKIRPRAMRILLTGYSDFSAILGSINDGEIYRFVHKPWSNADLQSMIGQAIEASRKLSGDQLRMLGDDADTETMAHSTRTAILVLDNDTIAVDELNRMLGADYEVHHATRIADGLDLLDRHPIGVLIVETMIGNESVTTLLGLLKQHHPQVVSIVLTHRSDATVAIELINQGQIFRFLIKPTREAMCKRSVQQAIARHESLKTNPALTQRYRVQESPATQAAPQGMLDRIRQLRGLFGAPACGACEASRRRIFWCRRCAGQRRRRHSPIGTTYRFLPALPPARDGRTSQWRACPCARR
jgi:DNA-binding NtrC family response regulator